MTKLTDACIERAEMSVLLRGPAWPQTRWRPELDGQRFRITRGRLVHSSGGMKPGPVFIPHEKFWRRATCQEMNCQHYREGWYTRIPLGPDQDLEDLALNRARYNYIRDQSGRSYIEVWEGSKAVFHFAAGQACFRQHQLPLERDPAFVHIKGRGQLRQMDYDQFFDTFNETSYQLARRLDRHG